MIELGTKPNLPMPCSTNIVGRLYVKLRKYHCIVDVYRFWSDGELVWNAHRWENQAWRRIPLSTRANERKFPTTLAKRASEFLNSIRNNY